MTSLVSALLLPPASLLILAALGLGFARRRQWGPWLGFASLAALAVLALPVVGTLLARPFESAYPPLQWQRIGLQPGNNYMVVVLGGGRDLGALEYPEGERLSPVSLQRARYAAKLSASLGVPLAVSGGAPKGGRYSEAALMSDFVTRELKQQVALVEDRSTNTRENATFTSEKLRQLGVTDVLLVTDVTHMPRAAGAFRATGLRIVPAPMRFHADAPRTLNDFLPSSEGMEKSHRVLRELLGLLWHRVAGA